MATAKKVVKLEGFQHIGGEYEHLKGDWVPFKLKGAKAGEYIMLVKPELVQQVSKAMELYTYCQEHDIHL